jgi:DNA-binding NtrC family response regulator
MKGRILIIEDEPAIRVGISHFLSSSGYQVKACEDGEKGIAALKDDFDLIITDLKLPKYDGLFILSHIKKASPDTGVIIITAYAEVRTAVQAIKDGAFDYISKPFSNEELLIVIERFFKLRNLEAEVNRLRASVGEAAAFENIIGISPAMKDVFDRISAVAQTDVAALIQGESGTGKELVANAIHNLSKRKNKPCLKINCAAIPESLFESELFGCEKGAFTGATETRKGKFETADKGSIFFDEIGDMPTGLQAKLLRVIEDHTISRLGGNGSIKVDVRGIYATAKNLNECVAAGRFREDLFYRINVVPITIPPLRERKEDIPCLIEHFLKHSGEKYGKQEIKVSQSAYDALLSYHYPGNVRQLKHAIERAVLLSKNGTLDVENLPEEFSSRGKFLTAASHNSANLSDRIISVEKQAILDALKETGGRKMEAAKKLGISRKALWKKIKDYSIEMFPDGDEK